MPRVNIDNIENVEGKYHLMFLDGKNAVEQTRADLRFSCFAFLLFVSFVLLFVLIDGFNLFYVGFLVVFLVFFVAMLIYLRRTKRKAVKACVYAVQNSRSTDIVAKQVDKRSSRAIVESMSSTIDRYDAKKKYPGFVRRYIRKKKHAHLVGIIMDFEKEEKKA